MDELLVAKYPFVGEAKKFLKPSAASAGGESEVSFDELEAAANHLLTVLSSSRAPLVLVSKNAEAAVRQHALVRLLLAALGNNFVARRYAEARARQAIELLRKEEESVFIEVARDLLPSVESRAGEYSVSFTDYLKHGTDFASAGVEGGRVFVDKEGLLRLLMNGVKNRVQLASTATADLKTIPPLVREVVQELREELGARLPAAAAAVAPAFKGFFLQLPCMQRILAGVEEGKRYYGGMALAIACLRDGLPKEKAVDVMKEYAANCKRATHAFTPREALATLDWVYKHPSIRLSCKTMREHGFTGAYCGECAFARSRATRSRERKQFG